MTLIEPPIRALLTRGPCRGRSRLPARRPTHMRWNRRDRGRAGTDSTSVCPWPRCPKPPTYESVRPVPGLCSKRACGSPWRSDNRTAVNAPDPWVRPAYGGNTSQKSRGVVEHARGPPALRLRRGHHPGLETASSKRRVPAGPGRGTAGRAADRPPDLPPTGGRAYRHPDRELESGARKGTVTLSVGNGRRCRGWPLPSMTVRIRRGRRGCSTCSRRLGAHATFFPIAPRAAAHPELIERMRRRTVTPSGCTATSTSATRSADRVGTARHRPRARTCSPARRAADAVADAVGRHRGVVGSSGAVEHGLRLVGWTVDTHDWRGDTAEEMFDATRGCGCATARSCSRTTGSARARGDRRARDDRATSARCRPRARGRSRRLGASRVSASWWTSRSERSRSASRRSRAIAVRCGAERDEPSDAELSRRTRSGARARRALCVERARRRTRARPPRPSSTLVGPVGRADGSVGRIFDGHLNAVERLAVQAPAEAARPRARRGRRRRLRVGRLGRRPASRRGAARDRRSRSTDR